MSYFNDLPQIDRDIIGSIIAETLKAGYVLSVFDGEETTVKESADPAEITAALCTTDDDRLIIRNHITGARIGAVWLVYGNEPGVVVCDYTLNDAMESILAHSNKLALEYEG